tara:strand:+ start:102489 stop:103805 length:1317 start_codon:yes stop_codon:yes gene_type:complete
MKKVLLLDFQADLSSPIRKAVTGTFGSQTEIDGLIGKMYKKKKAQGLIIPPLFFAYASGIFKQENWEIKHSYKFPTSEYDLIILATSMPGYQAELNAAKTYKEKYPQVPIIAAGAFSKEKPELFENILDAVIVDGEPELSFIKLAKNEYQFPLANKRIENGQVEKPDELPFPHWEVFNFQDFKYAPMLKGISVPVLTSRGCPYNCDYCHYMPEAGPNIRYREVDNVIAELKYLKSIGVENIVFRDLVFTLNKKRTIELCDKMIEEKLNLTWAIETRIDRLKEDLIDKMYEAGLRHLNLGIESPDPAILKSVGRLPANLVHQENIVKYIQNKGLTVSAFYILGFVQDNDETINNTINYAKKLNTLAAQFCIMTPFPGTKLYDTLKGRLSTEDWTRYTEYHSVVKLDHLSAKQIEKYRDIAYRKYYLRPSWMLKYWKRLI